MDANESTPKAHEQAPDTHQPELGLAGAQSSRFSSSEENQAAAPAADPIQDPALTTQVPADQAEASTPPQPGVTVGRIVHYQLAEAGKPDSTLAAMVTRVKLNGTVSLTLFHTDGHTSAVHAVPYWTCAKANHWTWPPRA